MSAGLVDIIVKSEDDGVQAVLGALQDLRVMHRNRERMSMTFEPREVADEALERMIRQRLGRAR